MQVFHFKPGHPPALAGAAEVSGETTGFYWLDIERSETDWHETAQRWLGTRLHERHIQDTLNETHPPYYDETDDYDLLVVRALCPGCPPEAPTTRPIAFIVTASAVISVRPAQDPVFGKLHQRDPEVSCHPLGSIPAAEPAGRPVWNELRAPAFAADVVRSLDRGRAHVDNRNGPADRVPTPTLGVNKETRFTRLHLRLAETRHRA